MERGHSHEDKIKILYEESLVDIREITGRIEKLVSTIDNMPARINRIEDSGTSFHPAKNSTSVNPWLAGFGTFGALGGFMLGLALNKDGLLSMALGFIVILTGGIGCFFYFWRKDEYP